MINGIVSNCWQTQLAGGEALELLIGEAARRGFRAIELRQGSLGPPLFKHKRGETAGGELIAEHLAGFPSTFPGIRFNVAIEIAFLSPEPRIDEAQFSAGKWAADAVAGENPPHLRLVDPSANNADWDDADDKTIDETASRIAELSRSMIEIDGALSLENSRLRWETFRAVFDAARRKLGMDAKRLKLCFDPCNLFAAEETPDPAGVTASLPAEAISIVHFKQRRGGEMLPTVTDGDVDWKSVGAALEQIHYIGPALLEIPPAETIWDNLDASRAYLQTLGFNPR